MAKDLEPVDQQIQGFEEPVYIFDDDRGRVPDFDKSELSGTVVKIFGISEPEDFDLGPVRFIKLLRASEPQDDEPWGIIIAASSPICGQVDGMARRGLTPFMAIMDQVPSQTKGHNPYWKIRRP